MDACEEYVRRWAKKEDVDVDTLSELVKSIDDLLKRKIGRLKRLCQHQTPSPFSVTLRLSENFPVSMRTLS